jgi:Transposase DDE domain
MSKDKYKVTNWKQYNEGLKQRGSLRLWIKTEIVEQWKYQGDKKRGGQHQYSDMAIELCLIVRKVYGLPLRQTEGFMTSFFEQSNLKLRAPDYTTISKRSSSLSVDLSAASKGTITDIVVDSTGLKVYGEGEWKVRKHGAGKHRTWMKMHVAVDETTQQIQAVTLTTNAVDDATEVSALLKQIPLKVRSFKADGAYDKRKVRKELYEKNIQQVIPPQHNAVESRDELLHLQQRDKTIQTITAIGRAEWKKKENYHQRSKSETAMFRYKTIIGNTLSARKIENQQTEVRIGCKILNLALQINKPKAIRVV